MILEVPSQLPAALTIHAWPSLAIGLFTLLLGIFVLIRERGSSISLAFLGLTTALSGWLVTFGLANAVVDPATAAFWIRLEKCFVAFLPSAVFLFAVSVLGTLFENRGVLGASLVVSIFFCAEILFTTSLVEGVRRYRWGFYPVYGPLGPALTLFFLIILAVSLWQLGRRYRDAPPGPLRKQLQNFFIAFAVACFGLVNFLPAYGIDVYPIGYLGAFAYSLLAARSIFHYHLRSITPAYASTQILQTMTDALLVLDPEGIVRVANPAAATLFNRNLTSLSGMPIRDLLSDVDFEADRLRLNRHADVNSIEIVQERKDEEPRVLSYSAGVVRTTSTPAGYIYIFRDVTEQKRAQDLLRRKDEELHQARKIEAIGRLAGGVAHDFNNLLTGINGLAEELYRAMPPEDARRNELKEILRATRRAFSLTRQLLAFGRRQPVDAKVLDINTTVGDMNKMLCRLIGEDVQLDLALGSNIERVKADPGHLEQVILNLVLNARDAMPQGGRIVIETSMIELTPGHRHKTEVELGTYIMLRVSDTGVGMEPDVLSHIFEPFFTTKAPGKGTGLGLATVHGVVKQMGGDIVVESRPGRGTTFKVFLPAVTQPAGELDTSAPEQGPTEIQTGLETILVAEDEGIVRRVVVSRLKKAGYTVLEARHGREALEVATRWGKPIDLLLTDVIMPGMNGRELARLFHRDHPTTRVLFMSGYPADVIAQHGILEEGISFIEKAAVVSQLTAKVREVLGKPKTSSEPASL